MVSYTGRDVHSADRITIGITTKDRWDELTETVRRLVDLGLGDVPMIVVDDGSSEARAEEVCKPLKSCTVIRQPVPLGLVEERNRIAQLATADYLIVLDDDSCLESSAAVAEAIEFMDSHPKVFCLAFRILSLDRRVQYPTEGWAKEYSGCGHLLRVRAFKELGGYDSAFVYMCEERDLSMRAYTAGKVVYAFPKMTVIHRVTQAGRSRRVTVHGFE